MPCTIKYHSEIFHPSLVVSTTRPPSSHRLYWCWILRCNPGSHNPPESSLIVRHVLSPVQAYVLQPAGAYTTPRSSNVRGRINPITKSSHPELLPHYTPPLSSHITMGSANYLMFQRLFDLPDTIYGQLWTSIIEHFRNEPDDSVGLAGPSDDDETQARFFSWVINYFNSGISQQYWGPETPGKWKLEKDRDS